MAIGYAIIVAHRSIAAMSRVFISYTRIDSSLSHRVANRINMNGLETYLDQVDDAIVKDGPDLADHLLDRMSECQQLVAVVSESTARSWWVPWEIGVGSEKGFRMASYSESYVRLPSYITKWPDLHSMEDIDLYCSHSKQSTADLGGQIKHYMGDATRLSIRKSAATKFHKSLSIALLSRRL